MLNEVELKIFLRDPDADGDVLDQIVELTNGLVEEITGPLSPVPASVRVILLNVAARAYRNPEGATYRTESIDDYSEGLRIESSGIGVYLTPAERATLRRVVDGGSDEVMPDWAGSIKYRS